MKGFTNFNRYFFYRLQLILIDAHWRLRRLSLKIQGHTQWCYRMRLERSDDPVRSQWRASTLAPRKLSIIQRKYLVLRVKYFF